MKVVIRTIESAEIGTNPWGSIARLRPIVNPGWPRAHDVYWHSAFWRWLESHPLANEMHRWVVVVDGDRVVGHLAAVPLYYRINGQRVVAHTPADYRVLRKYGFHALLLMRTFFRTCQNCVTCDIAPAVINIHREDLWRLGGFFRRDGRYTLMLKFADSGLHKVASDSANWTYNIGDSENSFWG